MEPIATYSEAKLDGKRQYLLFADEILVSGTMNVSSRFESSIPLPTLRAKFDRLWIQPPLSSWFIIIALLSICALVFFVSQSSSNDIVGPLTAFTVAMAAGALITCRKIEYALFLNHDGTPMLLIARSGAESKNFDSFVATIVQQIKASNEKPALPQVSQAAQSRP